MERESLMQVDAGGREIMRITPDRRLVIADDVEPREVVQVLMMVADVHSAETIARVCHEANRALCLADGDDSQPAWEDAPDWQRESAIKGIQAIRAGDVTKPEDSHESWMAEKEANGWVYGPEKDPEAKTHPCMVPYHFLPDNQRVKDHVFLAIAKALLR